MENFNPSAQNKTPAECARLAVEKLIEETRVQSLHFELTDTKPSIFESKVGGTPYLPRDMEVPVDTKNGKQMRLLAQINCEDLIQLDDYPHTGILQFWLTVDFAWENYQVIYHENVDKTLTEDEVSSRIESFTDYVDGDFPVRGEYGMEFTFTEETISIDDERIEALFAKYYTEISGDVITIPEDAGEEAYNIYLEYAEEQMGFGHKIGGYESRSQLTNYLRYKPEGYELGYQSYAKYVSDIDIKSDNSEIMIFQLDSEYCNSDDYNILWGDAGVAHFHISRKELKERKFGCTFMYWDCS